MSAKLLTEHQLKFLRLKGGCTGPSESTLVKMPHCWKSNVAAHIYSDWNINNNTYVSAYIVSLDIAYIVF